MGILSIIGMIIVGFIVGVLENVEVGHYHEYK